jgi:formylglycine-generating enzyme required for sulfatase activity
MAPSLHIHVRLGGPALSRVVHLLLVFLCFIALPATAADAQRVALVIGNGAYAHVPKLANPLNDADDVAASLGRLGFEVARVKDGRFDDMRRALRDFGRKANGAEMAVLFFAGHGMEIGGENWLIPVDAELQRDTDAESEALSLKAAMLQVASARRLGLVILDACRNNPFAARMVRSIRTRAVDRGLARTEPSDNVLVAYAAKEGTTAADGSGRNSPFTTALLAHIETPGLEINFLFRAVRDDVLKTTKNEQQPFVYGSLSREAVYLKAAAAVVPPVASGPSAGALLARLRQRIAAATAPAELDVIASLEPALTAEAERRKAELAEEARRRDPAQSVTPGSGKSFRDCPSCPEMVVVPAGSFMMGSAEGEEGRRESEGPQNWVTIAKPFVVGKFEVTFDDWDACFAGGGCRESRPGDYGWGRGKRPVITVSWDDAKAYVAWLSRTTGKSYRLLSETEWEYAARAGTTTRYAFGDRISDRQANYGGKHDKTVEVGSYPANAWGLFDVHGNVEEWLEDCWNDSYSGAPTDGSARTAGECGLRALRGGSFLYSLLRDRRSAARGRAATTYRGSNVGFRVARSISP